MKVASSNSMPKSLKALMTGLMSVAVIVGSSSVITGCKAKHVARGKLRSTSFAAPFSATLSASDAGWKVDLSQGGAPSTEYSVSSVSYVASAGPVPANAEGAATSGTVTFNANVNYTFQFNATKAGTNVTALCETTYAAPLRYAVEPTFVQCNADLGRATENSQGNTPGNENGSQPATVAELEADRTIGFAIQQYNLTVTQALTSLVQDAGYNFSTDTISRWNSLGAKVFQIVERYAGNEIAAAEEVTNAVSGDVQVADSPRVAEALIRAYSRPPGQQSPALKTCTCTVVAFTAGEYSSPTEEKFNLDADACAAKSGTIENLNSDPSSLFNDALTSKQFSNCSMR